MGRFSEEYEGLNVCECNLTEFFEDVEGKLALLTELVPYKNFKLTLEDIRHPLLVIGKPGVGKTCGILSSIREMNKKLPPDKQLGFKKILLGQQVVGALSGIPVVNSTEGSVVRVASPDLPIEERDGKYGVLFLDEITTADEAQIQPALGLTDDSRSIGEYTLPPNWIVIAAGNGPDCSNFIRLDDMTISRFMVYDVSYNYKKDFRPYAHSSGLNEDIIAFLNFNPDICVRVESTDMDEAGKLFPTPRSWERLSKELAIRKALGKEVPLDSIGHFAGRIVGAKAGREFGAFMQFKRNLNYSPERIIAGEERDPEIGMAKESYHIIIQGIIKALKTEIEQYSIDSVPLDGYMKIGNAFNWILKFHELENKFNAIIEIRDEVPNIGVLIAEEEFVEVCCPAYGQFLMDNARLLTTQSALEDIENLRF